MQHDPLHTANALPWEPDTVKKPAWRNERFMYVVSRTNLKFLLVTAVAKLQTPCCDDGACPGWLAACEGWHSAFNDLSPEDMAQVDRAMTAAGWHYPPDPGAVA